MSAKILIVDDEKAVRESLRDILQLGDYEVSVTDRGETALEMLHQEEFDVVLLDLKMEGIDGVEVMYQAHRLYSSTKVIILTGHGSLESAIEAIRNGAEDYLLKPFKTEDIIESIERALAEKTERQKKELLIEQLSSSLEQLKDVEGITTPELSRRRVVTLAEGIMVDLERREIWRGNTRIHLTPTEGKLLSIFLENRGRVMTHKEIVFLVQGFETTEWEAPEILRPMISRLRKKLAIFPGMDDWVSNVRGTGYVFDARQ